MLRAPRSWTYAFLGAAALTLQVVFLREFLALFHASELFAGAVLGVWLVGVGLGSALGEMAAQRLEPARSLVVLYGLLGFLCLGAVPLARLLPGRFGLAPGVLPPIWTALTIAASAMLPPCLLIGASFPLTAAVRRDAERVYLWDSAGGLVGGIIFAVLLLWWAPGALFVVSFCALVSGLLSWRWASPLRRPAWKLPGLAAALGAVFFLLGPRKWVEEASLAWAFPGERVSRWEETPAGRAVVTRTKDGTANVYLSGTLLESQADRTAVEEFAALAALAHPEPRRVVAIAQAAASLPYALADACPPEARVERVVPHVGPDAPEFSALLSAREERPPRRKDARAYLRSLQEEVDLIAYQPGLPEAFLSSRMLTREAFGEARAALRSEGVLAIQLPLAVNYQNEPARKLLAAVVRAMRAHFAHVRGEPMPQAGIVILASPRPLANLEDFEQRYAARRMRLPSFRPELLGPESEREFRLRQIKDVVEGAEAVPNADFLPSAIWYQARLTGTMYGKESKLSRIEPGTPWPGVVFVGFFGLVSFFLARVGGARGASVSLAFAAGVGGMLVEVALLCAYQVGCGALYGEVSALLGLVLAGAALGAWFCGRRLRIPASAAPGRRLALGSAGGLALVFALVFGGLIFPALLSRVTLWLLALSGGVVVGAAYPAALALGSRPTGARGRGGYLFAVDLAGAASGSILGGGLFVPLLGLKGTTLVALSLALVAAAGILLAGKTKSP